MREAASDSGRLPRNGETTAATTTRERACKGGNQHTTRALYDAMIWHAVSLSLFFLVIEGDLTEHFSTKVTGLQGLTW